jgi:hypothetical protein
MPSEKTYMTTFRLSRESTALLIVGTLTAVAISPVFLVAIPAMADFLNHLARMYVIAADGTADANPFYQVHFALYPDLAMDILVPPLARFIGVPWATKTFLIISQLLVVTGAMALEFVVKRRHEFAGFVALFTLYSAPFTFGLLNFEFGMGVALWGITSWIVFKNSWLIRLFVHSLFVIFLFLAHFFPLGVYGATIGLLELSQFSRLTTNFKKSIRLLAILAGPACFILALMILTGGALGHGAAESKWRLSSKLQSLFLFFNTYNYTLSVVVMACLIALLYFLFRERYLSIDKEGKRIAAGFFLLFILLPFNLFGSAVADVRMTTAAVLILPAFTAIEPSKRISWSFATAITSIAIIANVTYIASVWLSYQDDYVEIESSFPLIGSRPFVLIGQNTDRASIGLLNSEYNPIVSAPTLAVHYANAFVANLFASPGLQPVEPRPEYKNVAVDKNIHYDIPMDVLRATANNHSPFGAPEFIRNWSGKFDYLYIIGPHISNPLPRVLTQIMVGRRFTLYRITK